MGGVALHGINWPVMTTTVHTETRRHLSLLSALSLNNNTLFCTDHVLHWSGICVVVEAGSTQNSGVGALSRYRRISKLEDFDRLRSLLHVPPHQAAVC